MQASSELRERRSSPRSAPSRSNTRQWAVRSSCFDCISDVDSHYLLVERVAGRIRSDESNRQRDIDAWFNALDFELRHESTQLKERCVASPKSGHSLNFGNSGNQAASSLILVVFPTTDHAPCPYALMKV